MDINYYAPKRRLDLNSLLSLRGVAATDVYELIAQAIRLRTRQKHKEDVKFFKDKTAVLFTDKAGNSVSVAFEAALATLGGHAVVSAAAPSPELTVRRAFLSEAMGASAVFFDLENFDEIAPLLPASGRFFNAKESGSPIAALAVVLAIEKEFSALKGVRVAVFEKETPSEVSVALAKAQTDLTVIPEGGASETAIEYLSQFTSVRAGNAKLASQDAVVFDTDHPAAFSEVIGSGACIIAPIESPDISVLEKAGKGALSYDAAASMKDVFAAILSLIDIKE